MFITTRRGDQTNYAKKGQVIKVEYSIKVHHYYIPIEPRGRSTRIIISESDPPHFPSRRPIDHGWILETSEGDVDWIDNPIPRTGPAHGDRTTGDSVIEKYNQRYACGANTYSIMKQHSGDKAKHWSGDRIQHDFRLVRHSNGLYDGQYQSEGRTKQGVGFYIWDNHDVYVGHFDQDRLHGQGLLLFNDGVKVLGTLLNSKLDGPCLITLANQEIYCVFKKGIVGGGSPVYKYYKDFDITVEMQYHQGVFKGVTRIGQGKHVDSTLYAPFLSFEAQCSFLREFLSQQRIIQLYILEEDIFYIGFAKNELPNDLGLFNFSDGKYHLAQYKQGVADGFAIIDFENGDKFRGQIYQNKFQNLGYFYNSQKKGYYVGQFKNGKCHTQIVMGPDNKEIQKQVVRQYFDQMASMSCHKKVNGQLFIKPQMPLFEDLQKLFSKQVSLDYTFKINQYDFGVSNKSPSHKPVSKDESVHTSIKSNDKKAASSMKQSYFDLISSNMAVKSSDKKIKKDRSNDRVEDKAGASAGEDKNQQLYQKMYELKLNDQLQTEKDKQLNSFKNIQIKSEDIVKDMTFEKQEAEKEQEKEPMGANGQPINQRDIEHYVEQLENTIQQRNELLNDQFLKYQERESQQAQIIQELQNEAENLQKEKEALNDAMKDLQVQHKDGLEIIKNQSTAMLRHEEEHCQSKSQLSQMQARLHDLQTTINTQENNSELVQKFQEEVAQLKEERSMLSGEQHERDRMKKEREEWQQQSQQLQQQLVALKESHRLEIDTLQQEKGQLQKQVQDQNQHSLQYQEALQAVLGQDHSLKQNLVDSLNQRKDKVQALFALVGKGGPKEWEQFLKLDNQYLEEQKAFQDLLEQHNGLLIRTNQALQVYKAHLLGDPISSNTQQTCSAMPSPVHPSPPPHHFRSVSPVLADPTCLAPQDQHFLNTVSAPKNISPRQPPLQIQQERQRQLVRQIEEQQQLLYLQQQYSQERKTSPVDRSRTLSLEPVRRILPHHIGPMRLSQPPQMAKRVPGVRLSQSSRYIRVDPHLL